MGLSGIVVLVVFALLDIAAFPEVQGAVKADSQVMTMEVAGICTYVRRSRIMLISEFAPEGGAALGCYTTTTVPLKNTGFTFVERR